jgi:hypothetical protein
MIRLDNQDSRRNNSQTSNYQRYTSPINIHLELDIYDTQGSELSELTEVVAEKKFERHAAGCNQGTDSEACWNVMAAWALYSTRLQRGYVLNTDRCTMSPF